MKTKYDIIIFDFDDTLFDYEKTEERALRETCEYYDIEYKSSYYDKFKKINRELWQFHNQNNARSTQAMKIQRFEEFFKVINLQFSAIDFSETYTEKSQHGDIIDGVEDTINVLNRDVQLVIASNGPCTPRIEKLQNSPIAGKLKFYSSESFVERYAKPDPRLFYAILRNFKISSNKRVLAVGDKLATDILCANRASIDSVLFRYRNHNENEDIASPTYIIDHFSELLSIVYDNN